MTHTLGIDVGGSKVLGCLVDEANHVVWRRQLETGRATAPSAVVGVIESWVDAVRETDHTPAAIGVGFPGLVDVSHGIARSSVMLDGWHDVPLAQQVTAATALLCVLDNDVNAAAVAELAARRDDAPGSMVLLAIGTGIGGAVVLNGALWRGASGVAGEIGNTSIAYDGAVCWCGRRGCLNTLCSGAAIEARLGITPGSLAQCVAAGHPELDEILGVAANHLGIGIANAVNLLNPELVVLGGGVVELGPRFVDRAIEVARREAFAEAAAACRFELARAGYDAAAVGAARLGFEALRIPPKEADR